MLPRGSQVKICDFGFARQITSGGWYDSTTISGTAEYMPPEQVRTYSLLCCARLHGYRYFSPLENCIHLMDMSLVNIRCLHMIHHKLHNTFRGTNEEPTCCRFLTWIRSSTNLQLSGGLLSLKTDCWAMGTIMWEFATGRAPWGAVSGDIHGKLVDYVVKKGERLPTPGKKVGSQPPLRFLRARPSRLLTAPRLLAGYPGPA